MGTLASSARLFFDHLRGLLSDTERYAYLEGIPSRPDPFFEEEWIDFKSNPQNDGEAKKIWSKALSGYANLTSLTDGLVVWGINARKTEPRGVDAAFELRLVPDPPRFESKLRDWIRDATNPPVMGVEYLSVPGPNGEGFVVCIVPESLHKPHRAEWSNKQYYYRAGDDFLPAEPAMLRNLFYPRFSPAFRIEVQLEVHEGNVNGRPTPRLRLAAVIHNSGNSTARDVLIVASTTARMQTRPWLFPEETFWSLRPGNSSSLLLMAKLPLHPDLACQVGTSEYWQTSLRPDAQFRPAFMDFVVRFYIYCSDSEYQQHEVSFTQDDLLSVDTISKVCQIIR